MVIDASVLMVRLVWSSLVDNTGLTGYMGECLVLESLDAGLGLDDVEAVLCRWVPGFSAARVHRSR